MISVATFHEYGFCVLFRKKALTRKEQAHATGIGTDMTTAARRRNDLRQ